MYTLANEKINAAFNDRSITTQLPYQNIGGYDSGWFNLDPKYKKDTLNEIVEQAAVAHLGIQKLKETNRLNFESFKRVAKTANFSEGIVEKLGCIASESKSASFSEPYGLVGNYTSAPLEMVIQEVGTMPTVTPILASMFPNRAVSTLKVFVDKLQAFSGIAPEMDIGGIIPMANRLNSYALEYEAGLWGVRIDIPTMDLLYKRKLGGSDLAERGRFQEVAYNTINAVQMCNVRQHKLLADMVFNNGFTYMGANIASNIPTDNYINLAVPIGSLDADTGAITYDTSGGINTFANIAAVLNNPILLKYRPALKGILLNASDYDALLQAPGNTALNGSLAMGAATKDNSIKISIGNITREVMGFFATGIDIPFIPDSSVWVQQDTYGNTATTPNASFGSTGAQQYFVPRGKMLLLMDYSLIGTPGPAGAFHMTFSPLDPNYENPTQGLFTAVINRNLQNSDSMNRVSIFASLSGGPALYRPNDIFIIGGLYSNVS